MRSRDRLGEYWPSPPVIHHHRSAADIGEGYRSLAEEKLLKVLHQARRVHLQLESMCSAISWFDMLVVLSTIYAKVSIKAETYCLVTSTLSSCQNWARLFHKETSISYSLILSAQTPASSGRQAGDRKSGPFLIRTGINNVILLDRPRLGKYHSTSVVSV